MQAEQKEEISWSKKKEIEATRWRHTGFISQGFAIISCVSSVTVFSWALSLLDEDPSLGGIANLGGALLLSGFIGLPLAACSVVVEAFSLYSFYRSHRCSCENGSSVSKDSIIPEIQK